MDYSESQPGLFLGFSPHHAICPKRKRESSFTASPSKCSAVESSTTLESRRAAVRAWGSQPLAVADPEINAIMDKEKERQFRGIKLVASENFVCRAVMEALGSHLTNKYSEGMPGARYYTNNQYIDQIELLPGLHTKDEEIYKKVKLSRNKDRKLSWIYNLD